MQQEMNCGQSRRVKEVIVLPMLRTEVEQLYPPD
jgi:hypothetical protein